MRLETGVLVGVSETKSSVSASQAVVSRLLQMRQLWDDAAAAYFYPERFQVALQNCITTSRTVTFILQSNKHKIDCFDEWYAPHQERWRSNPIMTWVRDARNSIEKRGDLNTLSQVRAMIVSGYLDGPETPWMSQVLFASPDHILASVPKKFLIPHILENGTLLIERRWVDSELPKMEVLEALAFVYSELADMVVSLLEHIKVDVPSIVGDTRPDAMGALAMDRAIYLSMRDGSLRGFRHFRRLIDITPKDTNKLISRYGKIATWEHLKEAKTFRAVAEACYQNARAVMLRDGYHQSFIFLMKGLVVIRVISVDHPDRASRYVLMRELARLARIEGADGVMMISEVWTAHGKDVPKSGFAADAINRGEALMLSAANSQGRSFMFCSTIERRRIASKKVKSLGEIVFEEDHFQFFWYPFMKEWGCVDEEKIRKSFSYMNKMGIELPKIVEGQNCQ
ncbi:MAG: hypothetical protein PHS57_02435 [Alphaproteobacteria bacterium]|nr:hypothetical protein [Alphaproteobacteria bacterium]